MRWQSSGAEQPGKRPHRVQMEEPEAEAVGHILLDGRHLEEEVVGRGLAGRGVGERQPYWVEEGIATEEDIAPAEGDTGGLQTEEEGRKLEDTGGRKSLD